MGFGDLLGTGNLGFKRYEMAGGLRAQQFKNKFLGTRLCPSLSARNSIALHALDFVADPREHVALPEKNPFPEQHS